jgi:hypothetical protein
MHSIQVWYRDRQHEPGADRPVYGSILTLSIVVAVAVSGAAGHLAYAGGWKKFEPLWDLAIRSHRVVHALPLLEAVLTGFGRHHSQHEVASEGPHAPRRSPAGPASGTPEEQHRSKIDISAF